MGSVGPALVDENSKKESKTAYLAYFSSYLSLSKHDLVFL